MKIALICGGPSLERGISLNSARSAMDHLSAVGMEIIPIYFNLKKEAYHISCADLYSNTPSDFDYKLKQSSHPLSENNLLKLLKSVDLIFPVMHGAFGEDGEFQEFLEKNNLPFVGSGSGACRGVFDKFIAHTAIKNLGLFVLPAILIEKNKPNIEKNVKKFFKEFKLKRAIVKPASGGSSIGVYSVASPGEAMEKIKYLFAQKMGNRVVVEEFARGKEFTTIIIENENGVPAALPPTEIETDYSGEQIFDFRKKYLPSRQVIWHCPPRFNNKTIDQIRSEASKLFAHFGMSDFARFDGWVMPDGKIWFSDLNPISGMEQNSFLFQQASRIGLTHSDVLSYIIKIACRRQGVKFTKAKTTLKSKKRKKVNIVFGGDTSERQVSLMSGTNVWLKLRTSEKYAPQPHLLDTENNIWQLPYHLCLSHTVEEIMENCKSFSQIEKRLSIYRRDTRKRLGLPAIVDKQEFPPSRFYVYILIRCARLVKNQFQ